MFSCCGVWKNFESKYQQSFLCTEGMLKENGAEEPVAWHRLADRRRSQTVLLIFIFCPPEMYECTEQ